MENALSIELQGMYGKYVITNDDRLEVRNYRIALLICGLSFTAGLSHWLIIGQGYAWIWLIPMTISLGLALNWIHIYIRFLHRTLQFLWALGSLGIAILIFKGDSHELLSNLASRPSLTILIGPYFAAMTGLGFKEFFCFQRPEAIGLTCLLPISLGSHFLGIISNQIAMILICLSAGLLLILALRKFGMDAASDIGDKSVFEYLKTK
ncbi:MULTISPECIES: DUF2301 domain-containing membrane protein [unclassified Prochlorococcus]|uniref:DUF2301 domain-containing membrane protein n=1 Tax=unclassified Prochlorococcus TaxID=2627481 RepID=UPI00053377D0|nr:MULTISPECIES: DUF2301 domain-containing membrane protein [unclassified Prochlorococcus]KGG16713.1 hypothetical protein EV06_0555 [Prochlorococcus sp. MIT 0602]KGG18315.1 hypothetical protein EV07_0231 [Prochlorococcus sp. MIT 0603]